MASPSRSLSTTIRATQDVWTEGDAGLLFSTAAMRLWDHHLHTSNILPRAFVGGIYEHDWLCTYQSVTCFPQEALIELILEDGSNAESHVWVNRVGESTLYLSQMVTLYDQVLATGVRVLTRKSGDLNVPFTDVERYHFEQECASDQIILDFQLRVAEKYPGDQLHPSPTASELKEHGTKTPEIMNDDVNFSVEYDADEAPSNKKENSSAHSSPAKQSLVGNKIIDRKNTKRRKMTLSNTLSLQSFGTFIPRYHGMFLLAVRVGPQHLDYVTTNTKIGKFADVTWLADVAFQALCSAELIDKPSNKAGQYTNMAVRYRSVAMLGNELRCSLHGDRVIMIRSTMPELGETVGNHRVVLIAKAGPF